MLTGLDDVDWASMRHAYGSAAEVPAMIRALASPDAAERTKALSDFYSAVHHQGDIYRCTTASLPFLFALAADPANPGRAEVVGLVADIGREAVERCESDWSDDDDASDPEYADLIDHVAAARAVRANGDLFFGFATDPDPAVRRSGITGLGHIVESPGRAAAALRDRLPAEAGVVERLLVVETMATLALRHPERRAEAQAWLAELAADPGTDPETRIAALVHRARCSPAETAVGLVPAVVGLLQAGDAVSPPLRTPKPERATGDPEIADAFEHLDRMNQIHAPTTTLLRTLHEVLGAEVPQRTALLTEQLRNPDPGAVIDAIRMAVDLMKTWRGNHSELVTHLATHLRSPHHRVAAEAAAALHTCHAIAEPAREALFAHVAVLGAAGWEATEPEARRAHQEAVRALAALGDVRVVPILVRAFDREADDWRATDAAGALVGVAPELTPRLCAQLRRLDLNRPAVGSTTRSVLAALAKTAPDAWARTAIVTVLRDAVGWERWDLVAVALESVAAFGPAAAVGPSGALMSEIRALAGSAEPNVRAAAVSALWAVGRDLGEALPLLVGRLGEGSRSVFAVMEAADILGAIGPPAAAALPALRAHLSNDYDWVRAHCAAAIWGIAGAPEAPAVLGVLLPAMAANPSTANLVVACLDRMGPHAEPAVPLLREQLALPQRGGRFADITHDEELQRLGRVVLARFA